VILCAHCGTVRTSTGACAVCGHGATPLVLTPSAVKVKRYVALWIGEFGTPFPIRNPDAEANFVLVWPSQDIEIPWPEGMTPRQAIIAWAKDMAQAEQAAMKGEA